MSEIMNICFNFLSILILVALLCSNSTGVQVPIQTQFIEIMVDDEARAPAAASFSATNQLIIQRGVNDYWTCVSTQYCELQS